MSEALSTPARAQRLVVIGAGISGLAAARSAVEAARSAGVPLDVVVIERDRDVGGKAKTLRRDGYVVETGPTGYMEDAETAPTMRHLADVAGVEPSVVRASENAARRYVVRNGRPRQVYTNPLRLVSSGLLDCFGLARLAVEPFVPAKRDDADESVHHFAERRIGSQAADRLVAPMMLGIFAGDARKLSLPAAFPRLAALERDYGSLVRAMLARRRARRDDDSATRAGAGGGPSGPAGTLTSVRDGLQSLARGLARYGGFRTLDGTTVAALERTVTGTWRVALQDGGALEADGVVLACEPHAAARLLQRHAPRAAAALASIVCPPVVVVALGYRGGRAAQYVPRGFGMLVPRGESTRMLGCLWDSHIFPQRAPDNCTLVRAMLGGAVDPSAAALDDDDAIASVRESLARLLGLEAEPSFECVVRWAAAIPQYEIGHNERVTVIEDEVAAMPGVEIAGNALHGVAFAKAAMLGWQRGGAAARILAGRA